MNNPVIHFEMMSKDPAKASAFYKKIFGWKIENVKKLDYRLVETGATGEMKGINGGILKPKRKGPWPAQLTMYILVNDLAAYRKKIVKAGGTICVEEQEVPGMGWLCLFTDPEGRMMGLWKANM